MEQELYHYGILGMKWGIRRYQNKDGSLTEAGRKRYSGDTNGRYVDGFAKEKASERLIKDVSQISDRINKLESKAQTGKRSVEIQQLKKARQGLLNYRYGIEDGSNVTSSKFSFAEAAYDVANDMRIREQVLTLMNKDDKLMKSITAYKDSSSKLDAAYNKFASRLEKETGESWSGDGTELHWRLEEVYPEYRKISKQQERCTRSLVANAKRFASKTSADVKGLDVYPKYFNEEMIGWARRGNVFAAAVGAISSQIMSNADIHPFEFIDSYYLNKNGSLGKKIRDY